MCESNKSLSLAYKGLTFVPESTKKQIRRLGIEELDLSHNKLSDLRSLDGLSSLRTLVLDDNMLQSHVVFPLLPCLEHLWVNKNNIVNLPVFIEAVAEAFPCLKHLSMMNNLAAPSYFNGGSVESYRDYRCFVISHLPKLEFLDDEAVSSEEQGEAQRVYGKRRLKPK